MRNLFLPTVLCFALSSPAQNCPTFDTTAVVTVDSVNAAQLYSRAKHWFAVTFKDSKEVIQLDDPATGTIMGKGTYSYPSGGWLHYDVEIQCKDGRYRASVTNLEHKDPGKTYGGQYVGMIQNMQYGKLFSCDTCSNVHRYYIESKPKKAQKQIDQCRDSIVPIVRGVVRSMMSSIALEMTKATAKGKDDW